VKTEEKNGKLVIKADESQLPGMVFSQDAVQVELYRGDGFANPRTDTPPSSSLISTFRVSRDGTLLDNLELEEQPLYCSRDEHRGSSGTEAVSKQPHRLRVRRLQSERCFPDHFARGV
jgi:hypothetical protein